MSEIRLDIVGLNLDQVAIYSIRWYWIALNEII